MKDFDSWNLKKKEIEEKGENKYYHARDIWWCKLGLNIGKEQDGKDDDFQRPVLVIRGISKNICAIVPLTTSKEEHKYRISVDKVDGKDAKAIISQIRILDNKRFIEKIGVLNKEKFTKILKSVKELFDGF